MKKVAILQSNYIPWKGYFDLIASVDEFILYDDVQYTRQDWRNRNQIKTRQGLQWLTVPVRANFGQHICDTAIDGRKWTQTHWKSLEHSYGKAAHFEDVAQWLAPLYLEGEHTLLSGLNRALIEAICRYLGITTTLSYSWDYAPCDGKSERLVDLCRQAGAGEYISGPSAKAYLREEVFAEQGIGVRWFDYVGYRQYPQLWGEFEHAVSILDLLFNCGKEAPNFMRYVRQ
ncbi:WbqC family protein [Cupriavidus sp. PET2-C1]